jgi:hypothetical protein
MVIAVLGALKGLGVTAIQLQYRRAQVCGGSSAYKRHRVF